MFVGVVELRYQNHTTAVLITKCRNSHKHSQSLLTRKQHMAGFIETFFFYDIYEILRNYNNGLRCLKQGTTEKNC